MTSSSRTRKRNRRPRGAVKIDSSYIRSRDRSSRRAIVLSFDLRRHNLPLWICQRGLAIDINLARSTIDARGGTLKAFFFSFFSFSSPSSARQHADRPLPRAPEALPSPAAALPERSLARARARYYFRDGNQSRRCFVRPDAFYEGDIDRDDIVHPIRQCH